MTKTFIRRPGNKSKYLKHIIPLIPKFTGSYIEPFVGTGAVYLELLPKKAILNDLNTDIINIWKLVKQDPEYMIIEIDKFKKKFLNLSNEEKLKYCKFITSQLNGTNTFTNKKRTIMYLLMIYCSFNASIEDRFSSLLTILAQKNQCHIFSENYKNKLIKLHTILKNVKLYNHDYLDIIKKANVNDFIFLDPPYIEDKNYDFEYNKNTKFDIIKLKNNLDILTKRKIKWMMTQIDTKQVRDLFKDYKFKKYINNSNISCNNTQDKNEVIIYNYTI